MIYVVTAIGVIWIINCRKDMFFFIPHAPSEKEKENMLGDWGGLEYKEPRKKPHLRLVK